MKLGLSVTLATFNEEQNIKRCLDSVKKLADEIIVVDGESTDKTRQIARQSGATVIKTTNKPIFHINKQMAVDAAKGKWILALDADEQVTPELAKEIQQLMRMSEAEIRSRREVDSQDQAKAKKWRLFTRHQQLIEARGDTFDQEAKETVAFFVPRLNIFLGQHMRHTGVYPDGVIRLFKKGTASFPSKSVHEQLRVKGRVDWLTSDLLHYDSPTFEKYIKRANRYTSLTAQELNRQKVPLSIKNSLWFIVLKPVVTFGNLYIRHKGFLDGMAGFIFSLMSGLHWSLAYMKYWEIKNTNT